MSRTKEAIIKSEETPWLLTPAEQAFTRTFPNGLPWPDDMDAADFLRKQADTTRTPQPQPERKDDER